VLERIALYQPRLHAPGLSLDSKGVALGAKGLVLLPSIDRLVALLAVYTRDRSLEDLLPSLDLYVARSSIGQREIVLEFAAESTERMDRIAETGRLVGGLTFTGTTRHFVQYRDAAGPFGYDAPQLSGSDAALVLYHDRFCQTYDRENLADLRSVLLRVIPRADPSTRLEPGPRIVIAEPGLGPAILHYFVRSDVRAEVCVVEWPPRSALDEEPRRRFILRVPDPPRRMQRLLNSTPGVTSFVPVAPGVGVEVGFRHPVQLKACPIFDAAGLVLWRGRGDDPWVIERLPPMGDVLALARIDLGDGARDSQTIPLDITPDEVRIRLRLAPSSRPWRSVTATWIAPEQLGILRQVAYALPRSTIERMQIALTREGAIVRSSAGIEGLPIGTFFSEVHPHIYMPAGHESVPDVAADVLARALNLSPAQVLFLCADGRGVTLERAAFAPLESALIQAPPWQPLAAEAIDPALDDRPIDLRVESIGLPGFQGGDRGPPRA
jgi:FtsH ternary system-associated peptide